LLLLLVLVLLCHLLWKPRHLACWLVPGSSWGPLCHQLLIRTAVPTSPAAMQPPRLPLLRQPPPPPLLLPPLLPLLL
jgi:hypothetical protein